MSSSTGAVAIPPSPARALADLTHHRWALPVLAHVARHHGCKFVTLSRQLQVAPPSLHRALGRLDTLGLVVRNPGHGHPMRPEYILGTTGESVGAAAVSLVDWARAESPAGELFRKWQLPVLLALDADHTRFGAVRSRLEDASPRALSLALKAHAAAGLVRRRVEPGYPPTPLYGLAVRARTGRAPALVIGEALSAA